jgi:hypothetical protein
VFVNYRRDDTAGHAGRLETDLARRFGTENIFKDLSSLKGGDLFVQRIQEAIAAASTCIVLIGKRWLGLTNDEGIRRIDLPGDFVRLEIEIALNAGLRVIPVLVQGAAMPAAKDLPASIRALADRQAVELSESRWGFDVARLCDMIAPRWDPKPMILAGTVGAAVIAWIAWRVTGVSLPGQYRCTSDSMEFRNCRITESSGRLQLVFDGPGHGVDNLADTYSGDVSPRHCGFTTVVTNDFAPNQTDRHVYSQSRLALGCADRGSLSGTWSFADGSQRGFRMIGAHVK